jgi:hypothetical protein
MGGEESKPDPKQQQEHAAALQKKQAQEKKVATQIKAEQLSNNLDANIQQFNAKVKKYEVKIEMLK